MPNRGAIRPGVTGAAEDQEPDNGELHAVMHVEAKLVGHRWTLLEAAVRPAGGLIPEITAAVTGVNLYDSQLSVALGANRAARRCRPTVLSPASAS
jgi:hypothetical protein